jgi:hypothetical protein
VATTAVPSIRVPMRHPACFVTLVLAALVATGCQPLPPAEAVEFGIVHRAEWGAAAPVLPMERHVPRHITIHHTATDQQPDRPLADKLLALQRFSQTEAELADGRVKRAWADVPYHFYIAPDGTIAEARHVAYAGDTNTPYDPRGHLLIVLEGNFEHEQVTPAQWASLVWLTRATARQWGIPADEITGHRDHTPTLCPGEGLYRRLPELRTAVGEWL